MNQFASLGGTNTAYLAQDTTSLAAAFQAIAVDIESKTAAASAVSLNTGSWGTGTNLYQARFNSGDWSGQLIAYADQCRRLDRRAAMGLGTGDQRPELGYGPHDPDLQAFGGARRAAAFRFRWPASYPATRRRRDGPRAVALLNAGMAGSADGFGSQRVQWLRGNSANEAEPAVRARRRSAADRPASSATSFTPRRATWRRRLRLSRQHGEHAYSTFRGRQREPTADDLRRRQRRHAARFRRQHRRGDACLRADVGLQEPERADRRKACRRLPATRRAPLSGRRLADGQRRLSTAAHGTRCSPAAWARADRASSCST